MLGFTNIPKKFIPLFCGRGNVRQVALVLSIGLELVSVEASGRLGLMIGRAEEGCFFGEKIVLVLEEGETGCVLQLMPVSWSLPLRPENIRIAPSFVDIKVSRICSLVEIRVSEPKNHEERFLVRSMSI